MSDINSLYPPSLYLSPDQEDALLTALSSNNTTERPGSQDLQSRFGPDSKIPRQSLQHEQLDYSPLQQAPGSGNFEFGTDQSPYPDFDLDVDFDADDAEHLIGDLPDLSSYGEMESREKRKSMDGKEDDDEGGKKRRESEGSKKPGRKPLTAEPTSVGFLFPPNFAALLLVPLVRRMLNNMDIYRSGRLRIAPRSERSGNAKRNT